MGTSCLWVGLRVEAAPRRNCCANRPCRARGSVEPASFPVEAPAATAAREHSAAIPSVPPVSIAGAVPAALRQA